MNLATGIFMLFRLSLLMFVPNCVFMVTRVHSILIIIMITGGSGTITRVIRNHVHLQNMLTNSEPCTCIRLINSLRCVKGCSFNFLQY